MERWGDDGRCGWVFPMGRCGGGLEMVVVVVMVGSGELALRRSVALGGLGLCTHTKRRFPDSITLVHKCYLQVEEAR